MMKSETDPFRNRSHAGELLAQALLAMKDENPLILALPRGGIPVAAPVAQLLEQSLDVLFVKKIPAPGHPEVAIGAIADDGDPIWQKSKIHYLDIENSDLERAAAKARQALSRQKLAWSMEDRTWEADSRTVILIDDGLATGTSMGAAIDFIQKMGPKRIVVATPVASELAWKKIKLLVEEVVCLKVPSRFHHLGQFYRNFGVVSEREISTALQLFQSPGKPPLEHSAESRR